MVKGLPTMSFSPYGASQGPTMATSTITTVITRPVTSRRCCPIRRRVAGADDAS